MFTTLLIGNDEQTCATLKGAIHQFCRDVEFIGMAPTNFPSKLPEQVAADMIFWDASGLNYLNAVEHWPSSEASIHVLLLDQAQSARPDALSSVYSFLHKPLQIADLLLTLNNGRNILQLKRALQSQQACLEQLMRKSQLPDLVGIPTEKGMEFIPASQILRCEGMNKYTMIHCKEKKFISSYNIGEFVKLLQPYGFFPSHKSHVINLSKIRSLSNENQLLLSDGTEVPLSRRKRNEFLAIFRA